MSADDLKKAISVRQSKWTPENVVDLMNEGPELSIEAGTDFSKFSPLEFTQYLVSLLDELPKTTILVEDVFEEAQLVADAEGEAYSKPLIMHIVHENLHSAFAAIEKIPDNLQDPEIFQDPEILQDIVRLVLESGFQAGRDYQQVEFREKYFAKLETMRAGSHNGGEATRQKHIRDNQLRNDELFNKIDDLMNEPHSKFPTAYSAVVHATALGFGSRTGNGTNDIDANRKRFERETCEARSQRNLRRQDK
ncbi:hypothetical protein ACFE33_04400 [Falsihalocynthiibacter sp. SS001]|uniref:hypothetical protein n=1 Tax=Falsihalocynthiibacter sp. SS001 TaxID=3349698 RepID=UPI0036D41C57